MKKKGAELQKRTLAAEAKVEKLQKELVATKKTLETLMNG